MYAEPCPPQTRRTYRRRRSTSFALGSLCARCSLTYLAQIVLPSRLSEHFFLVARNVGRLTCSAKIENDGGIWLCLRRAKTARHRSADIFREGNAELGGLGPRPPLQLRVHGDLGACVHDGAIMPSPSPSRKPGNLYPTALRRLT